VDGIKYNICYKQILFSNNKQIKYLVISKGRLKDMKRAVFLIGVLFCFLCFTGNAEAASEELFENPVRVYEQFADKIYNKETLEELYYIGDITTIDTTETGTPQGFYIDYKNPKSTLKLYPIPDDTYSIGVVYNHFEPVIDAEEGTLKFEFENADDYINIPFDDEGKRYNLEWLFADCLVLMTMAQNNKDEQDENYRPTLNEFEERWKLFKKLAKPVKVNPRVVW
jgi:hypothetical protein